MLKRSGSEQSNPSKRIKTDNVMPPPSFVPRQPSSSRNINNPPQSSAQLPSSNSVKIKLQTSIKELKSNHNGYFSDDDEEDEELWFRASQIEERESMSHQKNVPDTTEMSYSEFQDAEGLTSTQNDVPMSQVDVAASQKIRVLQNKCAALEKQLKRNLPNIAKAQAVATQANCQINELKAKIKKLQAENEELKKDKLNDADRVSAATSTIRGENDSLRNQVRELNKKVRESNHEISFKDKSPLDPAEVDMIRHTKMLLDENQTSHFRALMSHATAYKYLKFDIGNINSKFHSQLVTLQMTIAELQGNYMKKSENSVQKFNNLRFDNKIKFNNFKMFNEITKIFHEISEDIKSSGLRHLDEHFVRKEFAYKQTQYCSDQYYGDKKNAERINKIDKLLGIVDVKNPLTKSDKIFCDEIRIDHRRLIGIISQIMSQSSVLSELMVTQNISTKSDEYKTVVDLICDIIDPHILQSRFLYKNSGITAAFADLIENLSSHYRHFKADYKNVNRNFYKFFSHLLAMSTNNPQILLNLSEFLINILSSHNGAEILRDLCTNFPSSNLEYSSMFKIYQIPRCGCMLQIFFILLTTAFRFIENVAEHNLDVLFELTYNFNTLAFLIIANGCDVEFLRTMSADSSDIKNHCKCFMFLVMALIILNNQALRHRNIDNNKYHLKVSSITKSAIVTLVALLSYTGQTIDYRSFTFGYNAISEIYTWITFGDIYVDDCERFYNCKSLFLTQESHGKFLERILTSTSNDYSYSFITCDSNPEEVEAIEDSNDAKDDLWNEITMDFRADECDITRVSFPR
ncbi:uncharacterized protein [Chironomus tepperi]|uniref:uncharacterized protein n=1 Tax=Chironomus tepperi TaxID=113505 RepID=UPI00391F7095